MIIYGRTWTVKCSLEIFEEDLKEMEVIAEEVRQYYEDPDLWEKDTKDTKDALYEVVALWAGEHLEHRVWCSMPEDYLSEVESLIHERLKRKGE